MNHLDRSILIGRIVHAALSTQDPPVSFEDAGELLAHELLSWDPILDSEIELARAAGRADGDGLATFDEAEAAAALIDPEPFRMYWLDAVICRVAAKLDIGEAVAAREKRVAARATERRKSLWEMPTPRGLVFFAKVAWAARVRARWERSCKVRPAVTRDIAYGWLLGLSGRPRPDAVSVDGNVSNRRGEVIGTFEVATIDPEIMRRGVAMFSTTLGHRLVRALAIRAHSAFIRGDTRADHLRIDGGLSALARSIGCDDNDTPRVEALLAAGQGIHFAVPHIGHFHGLWTWNQIRAAPKRGAYVEIALNPRVFLPTGAFDKKVTDKSRNLAARAARRLVPILLEEPPHRMLAMPAEWGLAWSVSFALVAHIVDHADKLVRDGAVTIDRRTWERVLNDAGLSLDRLPKLREGLLSGDGIAPPLLTHAGGDRYTLSDAHARELQFIKDGGAARIGGEERQRSTLGRRQRGKKGAA